ncbi:RNA ligase family protein [Rickettsiella endosymbiont of Xylota segnis]|uniref:RNA ligase family protein n=1 Tax=Rickettsiella endosymbiont of Xylota segnis TaxID=3066238 RepID=UPI0030CB6DCB
MLVDEANSKRIFLIPIDKNQENRDINVDNIHSLISLIEAKLNKCAKDTNMPYNASILIVNGEKNYKKQRLIDELEKLKIRNYRERDFSPGESKSLGISVHFFKDKNSSIKVKLFPFSGNLIYFPIYPKIPGPKKNHAQGNSVEFSVKLDGANITLQYDGYENSCLNAITRYHTINPKSHSLTPIDKKWIEFLDEDREKILAAILTNIKESYPEKNYDRILIGGEFCFDPNTGFYGFFIHSIRGIKREKTEFLDNKKIHELAKQNHENLFSEAKENSVQIYFMRQWFSKIDTLPATELERKDLLHEMLSSLYGKDFAKKIQSGEIAANNIPEGVVGVEKADSNRPVIKIKFDQFKDLDMIKLNEFEQQHTRKRANVKITPDDLKNYCKAILTQSRLTKIKQYFCGENRGMTHTISWAIGDIIKELKQENQFRGVIQNNIITIKERLETEIKGHLESTLPLNSSNFGWFSVKPATVTPASSSKKPMEMIAFTKH